MVEWKTVNEICSIVRGNRVTKSDLIENGKYPVISGGVSPLGYTDKITEKAKLIINNRSKLSKGDILFSGIGTIGKVAYVNIPTDNWTCSSLFLLCQS